MAQLVPSYAQQQFRLLEELEYGVANPAATWRRMNAMRLNISPTIETETFAASGDSVPSIVNINDDYAEGSLEGKVDYNSIHYPLSSLFGATTPTVPGGGSISRRWAWNWTGRGIITPKTYRMCVGSEQSAEHVPGALFNGMSISGNREGMDLDADIWGMAVVTDEMLGGYTPPTTEIEVTGTPTGGDFTLRFGGTIEVVVAYDETAADTATAVQAALQAAGSPTTVAGSGGPFPGTPVVLTYSDSYPGHPVVKTNSLTGGTTPAVAVTEGTAANDDAVDVVPKPMFPLHASVYLDNTWAGLGTTQLKHAYDMDLSIGEKYERTMPINRSRDSDSYVEIADQDHTLDLTLAVDYRQRKILEDVRVGEFKFFRYEAIGGIIEGAIRYDLLLDLALMIEEVGEGDENNNIYVREFSFKVGRDATSGMAAAAQVTNVMTAY